MQNTRTDLRVRRFLETCRRHQLKITPQRVAIFRMLIQSKQHPSAEVLFRSVKKEFPNISFDTVNRTLLTFADIGVVAVVEVFGGPRRFDPDITAHHHLHCMACGRIIDFEYAGFARLDVPESITGGFTVTSKRVVLKGLCDRCNLKRNEPINQPTRRKK
ncbi:transcriptional repressor [Desulfosarcina alkanivorans]|uniref:Transcriptional repressor n=1 Tax=Desulfosarcina alkanivorans TaxID=571177 RepID=A0A5K7YQ01_9BACT|nr:Fur family transcriptional regulator [Desulfosarcina alkanivorans]BBO70405.1 transcriptional repressor [Desulfosarcina alkanivorans]